MQKEVEKKIEKFFGKYPERKFSKGQMLIYARENPTRIYYLQSGQVKQYDITQSGDEVVVNVFKNPAFFPMSWLINKTPNMYFFEAYTELTVRTAPADLTLKFIKANPDVVFDLMSRVFTGLDGVQRRMAHLMGGGADTRVLFELILEGKRFGKKQANGSVSLEMHESELASRSGLARETVSRQLTKISKKDLIEVTHKSIFIKDMEELEKQLDEDIV